MTTLNEQERDAISERVHLAAARAYLEASSGPECTDWYADEWCQRASRKAAHRAAVEVSYRAGQAAILREWAEELNEAAGLAETCTERAAELLRRADHIEGNA